MRRVGHKGADLIAPGNTTESFDAALEAGVDMIEFDVLREEHGDELILAHDYGTPRAARRTRSRRASPISPRTRSERSSSTSTSSCPATSCAVLEALRDAGVLDRALISSQYRSSLELLRAAEPAVRLGWSVPKLTRGPVPLARGRLLVALVAVQALRLVLPAQAARAIRARRCDALMVHWRLVTPRLVRRVRDAGGELYVWTVDELPRLRQLEALGVTGVITNDPRLFAELVV